MSIERQANDPHWDPRSEPVLQDQIAAYDEMRRRCPVARSDYGYASVFRHADVLRIIQDHETFSSAVSRFPSVPNGMDPPDHTAFRALINPYFSAERVAAHAPACRQIVRDLLDSLPSGQSVDFMAQFARVFAVHAQCAFLGWSADLYEPLLQWSRKNYEATLNRDPDALAAVALEFDSYITALLDERRAAGKDAPPDATTRLLTERIHGRALTDDEIVSILRNWTVGELGTIAASVGILAHYMAAHPALQQRLRDDPALLPAAIDEILRIHPPLILNRRVATKDVNIGGTNVAKGERLAVLWASANRDESVFGDPDEFRLDRDPQLNLLYGTGIHVCPGAGLARQELLIVMQELLAATSRITADESQKPVNAFYPGSGFASLALCLQKV